jgi:hypothetical protein
LMGLSQGGYLGKKLVTVGTPLLYPIPAVPVAPGAAVTLTGASFGATQGGSVLLMGGTSIPIVAPWGDTAIIFGVPAASGDGTPWPVAPAAPATVQLQVVVNGQPSNSVPLQIRTG